MAHTEVAVRVTAWVDEGVAPLVGALNTDCRIVSLASCQEGDDGFAYVEFTSAREEDLRTVVGSVVAALGQLDECPASLSLTWWYGSDAPVASVRCPPADVARVASHLAGAASCVRRTPFPRGTPDREPRSSTGRRGCWVLTEP